MLNTRNEEKNAAFYSYLDCFVHLEYVRIYAAYRVDQAEDFIHIIVVAPQEYVKIYSTRGPVTLPLLLSCISFQVEFNTIARQRHSNDRQVLNRLLKDNVAQVLLLEMIAPHPSTRRQVMVANTHINASPEFADVKLWQTQHLLLEIERMMTQHSGSTSTIPVVAAGDFNSLPGSDPHTLLANGLVQPENGDPSGVLASLPMRHSLPLRSAMATVGAHANASAESHELQRMEPPYTNYTTRCEACSRARLALLKTDSPSLECSVRNTDSLYIYVYV